MTSLAFILGIVPLVVASGAGSAARRSLGTAVFGGMLAATTLTILFVPMFYVVIQRLGEGQLFGRGRRVSEETDGLADTRRPGDIP